MNALLLWPLLEVNCATGESVIYRSNERLLCCVSKVAADSLQLQFYSLSHPPERCPCLTSFLSYSLSYALYKYFSKYNQIIISI